MLLVAVLFVSFPFNDSLKTMLKTVFSAETLYSCFSLSCLVFSFSRVFSLLSSLSDTYWYSSIYIYLMVNWEQLSFQPMLYRTHATQSQSFDPLAVCSSSCMQTHSHSTDHSLIPCYYHRHTLSYCYIKIVLINPKGRPYWALLRLLHDHWDYCMQASHCTALDLLQYVLHWERERERTHFFSEN